VKYFSHFTYLISTWYEQMQQDAQIFSSSLWYVKYIVVYVLQYSVFIPTKFLKFVYCKFWCSFSYMFLQDIPNILCLSNLPFVCWMLIWEVNLITISVWKKSCKEVKSVAKDCLRLYPYGYVEILKKVLTTLILLRAALTRMWW